MIPDDKNNQYANVSIEQALLKCVQTLNSSENIEAAIQELLIVIAKFHDADRAYIFEFDSDGIMMHNTYEWCREGIASQMKLLSNVQISVISRWVDYFKNQGEFYINSLDEIISKDSEEYRLLTIQNIDSLMAAPLISNNHLVGFLGVDNPRQCTNSLLLLQSVAAFIVNDIQKLETMEHKIISALGGIYISMHVITLSEDSCREITSNSLINSFLDREQCASAQIQAAMRGMTAPSFRETMLEFTNLATLPSRMADTNTISQEFLSHDSVWCRANFILVSRDENGSAKAVIYAVQRIDEVKRRELEYQAALRAALENQNEIYTEILQLQDNGTMAIRIDDYQLMAINPAALKLFGFRDTKDFGGDIRRLIAKTVSSHKEEILNTIQNLQIGEAPYVHEWAIQQPDGSLRHVLSHVKIAMLSNGCRIWLNSLTDITDKKKLENKLLRLSEMDALTGLYNRGSGERKIEKLLAARTKGMFCLFDVNKFKSVNDTFGHAVGDKVLVALADCLKQTFGENDIVMRLGGDEYAVYASGINDEASGEECILRFLKQVECIKIREMGDRKVSVSLGAVLCTGDTGTVFDEIYQKADSAMYLCKNGKDKHFHFYRPQE